METNVNEDLPRNPYIGPTAFQTGEQLYGRDRECSQLSNLIVAERIVLLHSPSGAGKTSLIQAALIPKLVSMRFLVLPVVRVNMASPATSGMPDGGSPTGVPPPAGNRYVFSALLCLNSGLPAAEQIPADRLAGMRLADFLRARPKPAGAPPIEVMIFDQFEEILTLDSTDAEAKREFFQQLDEVFDEPRLWALFSMRDDYVAALAPYELWAPSHFQNRFRLDLLGREAAKEAIQRPAAEVGVHFEEEAANTLVDDLRRVRVQQADGSFTAQLGSFVEPVQLQVVCQRLWEDPRPDPRKITPQDLVEFGEINQSLVDTSLADYYARRVKEAAAQNSAEAQRSTGVHSGVSERSIREWFDRRLITEHGVRSAVLMEAEKSGGLDNRAVRLLQNTYLVRAEKRGGMTWFELAHDRLIGPIRADNAAWFRANLSMIQLQADLWDQHDRPENLLMDDQGLAQARLWVQNSGEEIRPVEVDFIAASEKQAARARLIRRRNQIISVLAVVALLLAILSGLAYRQAVIQRGIAERQARAALANQYAAQSQTDLDDFPLRSLLLAVEAINTTARAGQPRQPFAEEALRAALREPHGLLPPGLTGAPVTGLAYSPDGRWLAAGSGDGVVLMWDMHATPVATTPVATTPVATTPVATTPVATDTGVAEPRVLSDGHTTVWRLAFSPDGRRLAVSGKDPGVRLWDLTAAGPGARPVELSGPREEQTSLVFSPDGQWLAAGSLGQNTWLWRLDGGSTAAVPLPGEGESWATAFSPDGRRLASSDGAAIRLWDLQSPDPAAQPLVLRGHQSLVTGLAFSPDGRRLASSSRDRTARVWDLSTRDPSAAPLTLEGHEDWINTLVFSPDGRALATASGDKTVRLWRLAVRPGQEPEAVVLRGHEDWVGFLAFSADGRWLASGSGDKTARVWDLRASDPAADPLVLRGHDQPVFSLAFAPDSRQLATASSDGFTRLWEILPPYDASANPRALANMSTPSRALAFSPDGAWLAAGSGDPAQGQLQNTVLLWAMTGNTSQRDLSRLDFGQGWVSALAFSPDGRWLAAGGGDPAARVWDLQSGAPAAAPLLLEGPAGWIWSLAFSPDGKWLAAGSEDGSAVVWRAEVLGIGYQDIGEEGRGIRGIRDWEIGGKNRGEQGGRGQQGGGGKTMVLVHGERVNAVGFSPDGRWLATGGGFEVRLWDLLAADPAASPVVLLGHTDTVLRLAFSPDGKWLASTGRDATVHLWDLRAANPAAQPLVLVGHLDWVNALVFSPDGHWLVSGSNDNTARLWNLTAANPAGDSRLMAGHDGPLLSAAFSQDGARIATSSADGTARLWTITAGGDLDPAGPSALRGHTDAVNTLAFSPDGGWLATAGQDGRVRLWLTRLDALTAAACRSAGRNFTQVEWRQFFPGMEYRPTCPEFGIR